jgi:hypothetical protein
MGNRSQEPHLEAVPAIISELYVAASGAFEDDDECVSMVSKLFRIAS